MCTVYTKVRDMVCVCACVCVCVCVCVVLCVYECVRVSVCVRRRAFVVLDLFEFWYHTVSSETRPS
jgi:hypothetical protein